MSYCINPRCLQPDNSDTAKYCQSCGFSLRLQNRYRPVQPIGQGGFGRTFLAIDEQIPSRPNCVIKEFDFPERDESYDRAVKLFHQEAVRLDCLGEHPQIPKLLAHFDEHQLLFLVQEYIPGKTLWQEFQRDGVFDEQQIWQLLRELLPVLQFIHDRDIIHRDIKPANLIRRSLTPSLPPPPVNFNSPDTTGETRTSAGIRDRPRVPLPPPPPPKRVSKSKSKSARSGAIVLIDFGVAKLLTATALSNTGTVVGSPEFMAPEQTRGRVFPASDLYSLGATCLYLLTGISPWQLYDPVREKWIWRDFLTADRAVSSQLGKILDGLVNNQLRGRYPSAQVVLEAIAPKLKPKSKPKISTPGQNNSLSGILGKLMPGGGQPPKNDVLASERGVDYRDLRQLLASHRWREADRETWVVLCRALGRGGRPYLHPVDLKELPGPDLGTIDGLWVKYSRGRFGFSVQAKIFGEVGQDYGKFCDRVGWLTYIPHDPTTGFDYRLRAPAGHLPTRSWVMGGGKWWQHLEMMTERLGECGLL